MRSSLVLVVAAAAAILCAVAAPAAAIPGGWGPIPDANATEIRDLGAWAVREHLKQGANGGLRFRRVVSGQQQVVSGMNYRLRIDALNLAGKDALYDAVVYEQSWTTTRKLLSFTPATGDRRPAPPAGIQG